MCIISQTIAGDCSGRMAKQCLKDFLPSSQGQDTPCSSTPQTVVSTSLEASARGKLLSDWLKFWILTSDWSKGRVPQWFLPLQCWLWWCRLPQWWQQCFLHPRCGLHPESHHWLQEEWDLCHDRAEQRQGEGHQGSRASGQYQLLGIFTNQNTSYWLN